MCVFVVMLKTEMETCFTYKRTPKNRFWGNSVKLYIHKALFPSVKKNTTLI